MHQMQWFDRKFTFDHPPGIFPGIVERLRGTPARLAELLDEAPSNDVLTRQPNGRWSINEHVGHLGDLEELWSVRIEDVLTGASVMTEADLTNRRTHEAGHNSTPLEDLLQRFRRQRTALVSRLESLGEREVVRSSLHPRLEQPMRILDLAVFVAEHDDHHLARISEALL